MKTLERIVLITLALIMFVLGTYKGEEDAIKNSSLIECSNHHAAIRFGDEEIYYSADWQ